MATSYTAYEAIEVLAHRDEPEKVSEIHRRFPYFADFAVRALTKAQSEFLGFAKFIPEYVTANKINGAMKKQYEGTTLEDAAEKNVVESSKHEKNVKEDKATDNAKSEYSKMPAGKLKEIIKEKGLEDVCRSKFGRINHDNMVKTLEAYDAGEIDAEEPDDDAVEEGTVGKYDGVAAPALFKMCKERGIKAKPKQTAKFYVELLEADDAKNTESEEEDDWDDPLDDDINASLPDAVPSKDNEDDDDWDL